MVDGAGIGFRPQLASALLRRPERVGFLEVVAESCRAPAVRREIVALSRVWPVVLHGVSLSPGSAAGIDPARSEWFGDLARELRASLVSEHMAFVRAGGREIGHLTELPRTREAVAVLARNVAPLRRAAVPLLLENPARAFVWRTHEMTEGQFLHEVTAATGCPLLLDVANLHANAMNGEVTTLEGLPLDRVGLVHVAGGDVENGYYFDTHAHAVPEPVFALAAAVLRHRAVPVLLERDGGFEDPDAILAEVDRLRAMTSITDLGAQQSEMARLLLGEEPAPHLEHARTILRRKEKQHERSVRCVAVEHGPWRVLPRFLRDALRGRDAGGAADREPLRRTGPIA